MKFPLTVALSFAAGMCLPACGKHDPESPPPPLQTQAASPAPDATPRDELDPGVNPFKKKANAALASVENFLQKQNPRLRAKLRKEEERIAQSKDKWREKLLARQKELQPQIDRLKERLGQVDSRSRDRLSEELARLQEQSRNMDQEMAELEAAGKDGWTAFRARLKDEEAKAAASASASASASPESAETATPTP